MPLTDRLPVDFPRLGHLTACERVHRGTPVGERVCGNIDDALSQGLLEPDLFLRFCGQLGPLLGDDPSTCDPEAVQAQIDDPEPFFCRGPEVAAPDGAWLSRVVDLEGFLYAHLDREPWDSERRFYRRRFVRLEADGAPPEPHPALHLRGPRRLFWVTPADAIASAVASAAPSPADRLRDLLGLSGCHANTVLLEMRFPAGACVLHRPTALDALDNPTFYPSIGGDGWGITNDLAGPRPTPGLSEAVAGHGYFDCLVATRGQTTTGAPRI